MGDMCENIPVSTHPAFAYLYTTETESFDQIVNSQNYSAVYVYGGSVEMYRMVCFRSKMLTWTK